MIRLTIWNENMEEHFSQYTDGASEERKAGMIRIEEEVNKIHPEGIHGTLATIFKDEDDIQVTTATLDMPGQGLPDEVLNNTDVLIWWGHCAHDKVSDELVEKIHKRVLSGMGFIALHSAHMSKPLQRILGTSNTLQWREGDFCRVWCTSPAHPIAAGVDLSFELSEEEMYGEFFDIPQPDELVFVSWYRGGEVFRSGCCWNRGYGKVFYFQPGHETNPSYHNANVRRVILNAVRWAAPVRMRESISCPNSIVAPEDKYRQ